MNSNQILNFPVRPVEGARCVDQSCSWCNAFRARTAARRHLERAIQSIDLKVGDLDPGPLLRAIEEMALADEALHRALLICRQVRGSV